MKFLLDTHAFLWWETEPEKLSKKVLLLCEDASNEIFLSVASIWEIQIKVQLAKLALQRPLREVIARQQRENAVRILPIDPAHVFALDELPPLHRGKRSGTRHSNCVNFN